MDETPYTPHLVRSLLEHAHLIRDATRPQLGNPEPQIHDGGEGYGREEGSGGADGEEDARGGGRVEAAAGDEVGVDDAVEEVAVDAVVEVGVHVVVGPAGAVGEMEGVVAAAAGAEMGARGHGFLNGALG